MVNRDLTEINIIGSRIRDIRIKRKMSQSELAEKSHISLPHISDIERGKINMRLDTFISIAEALQVSTDHILRPNIPQVNSIYQSEFSEILSDCSPIEIEAILKIVAELKTTMRTQSELFDD